MTGRGKQSASFVGQGLVPCRRQAGFTLTELMVVVGIMVLLLIVAVPTFTAAIRSYRSEGGVQQVQASLQAARSYAVRHHALFSLEFRIDATGHYMVSEEEKNAQPDAPRGSRKPLPQGVTFADPAITYEDPDGNPVKWTVARGWIGNDDLWEDLARITAQRTLDDFDTVGNWPAQAEADARPENDTGGYTELGDIAFGADGTCAEKRGETTVVIEDATDPDDIRYWKISVNVATGQIETEPLKIP